MPLFDRPPIDAISVSNTLFSQGTFRLTGGPGIVVGSDASGASVSASDVVVSYYDNMVPSGAATPTLTTGASYNSVFLFPLDPGNERFVGQMTVSTVMMQFSISQASSSSAAYTSTVDLGVYSRVNATSLALINSARSSWNQAATSNQSNSFHGLRWLTINSSQFSSSAVFTGGRYYMGLLVRSSSNSASVSMVGQVHLGSNVRSGTMNVSATSGNTGMGHFPLMGAYNTTTTALPVNVGATAINQATPGAGFVPMIAFNNLTASF